MPRTNRIAGHVVYVAPSRSGRYWALLKDSDGLRYFAYGKNWLDSRIPRPGWPVSFTPLMPGSSGKMRRAIEVQALPRAKPRPSEIAVVRDGGVLRVVLVNGSERIDIGALRL
jgi:hypothetical protein